MTLGRTLRSTLDASLRSSVGGGLPWEQGGGATIAPAAPTISGAVVVGGTLTITPDGGGGPPATYAEYQGGVATGRSVAASGTSAVNYNVVAADIDTGTDITFRAVNAVGMSADSNALRITTYVVSGLSGTNYYQSANGTAPTSSTFSGRAVLQAIALASGSDEWDFIVGSPSGLSVGYTVHCNTNGLGWALVSDAGFKFSPTFALGAGDVGSCFVLHWTFDGATIRLYVNGAEVGTGTSMGGATFLPPDGSSAIRHLANANIIGVIETTVAPTTVWTPLQIADDAAAIMSRTDGLIFPTMPGETIRHVAARLVGTSDWHDSIGDDLTLAVNGAPTLAVL